MVNNHKLLKIDELTNLSISTSTVDKIFKILKKDKKQILVYSDFRHGIFNNLTMPKFLEIANTKNLKLQIAKLQVDGVIFLDFLALI